jgi:predicted amidohydrolase YtcJ
MLECVWCAVNRMTRDGVVLGKAEEGIDVRSALKAVTINAAYQYHEEASKGTIAPHKRADLVILDRDPLQIDPMDLKTIKILETIKDGSTVYTK